jgi:hypothetical protein
LQLEAMLRRYLFSWTPILCSVLEMWKLTCLEIFEVPQRNVIIALRMVIGRFKLEGSDTSWSQNSFDLRKCSRSAFLLYSFRRALSTPH